jgi:2'-5' RNA ligase superfamily
VCAVSQGTGSTRLVVPVAEIVARVPGAHITLVDPFLDAEDVDEGVIAELRELFADLVPFAYILGEPARFPSGAEYLPPQPVTVFRRITHSLRRAFPEVIGPATSLDTVVPHLPLPVEYDVPTPLEVHAREALLLGDGGDTIATFRFGTSAA